MPSRGFVAAKAVDNYDRKVMTGWGGWPLSRMLMGHEKMRTFMKIGISLPVIALLAVWASEFVVRKPSRVLDRP
jgi:hypothetical protein